MYRLLLPGIRLKRWILVARAGMVLFATGFSLLVNPHWDIPEAHESSETPGWFTAQLFIGTDMCVVTERTIRIRILPAE